MTDNLYKELSKKYKELFTAEDKVKAFDEIAKNFYFGNFASMPKAEIDLLMFSIYLDKILDKSEEDLDSYSDYKLSKIFGITQRRIINLKEKKQLKYPREFEWEKVFLEHLKNARYDNGYFIVNIRDINLYRELENAIDSRGGYIDVQLNPKILKLKEEYFIDLILTVADDEGQMRKAIRNVLNNSSNIDISEFEDEKSIGDILKSSFVDNMPELIAELVSGIVPVAGSVAKPIIKDIAGNLSKKYIKKGDGKS